MTITLLVNVKGGSGSGNWGHAGRPGLVGGSGGTTGGQRRLGKTLRRAHLSTLEREERLRGGDVAKVAKVAEAVEKGVVNRADQLVEGDEGFTYFIRNDGKLVDVNAEEEQMHDEYVSALRNPSTLLVGGESAVGFNELPVSDKYDRIWNAGNLRVMAYEDEVGIQGDLSRNNATFKRVQGYVLEGKLPYADNYVLESSKGKHVMSFDYDSLMEAESIRDIQ